MALSPENARQSTSELFGIQNSLKSQRGQLKGLQDPAVMAQGSGRERGCAPNWRRTRPSRRNSATRGTRSRSRIEVARQIDAERNFIA